MTSSLHLIKNVPEYPGITVSVTLAFGYAIKIFSLAYSEDFL